MTTHYPNFDLLRLVAASSVVFSHSFLIATGSEATEPLVSTGKVMGVYGVFVFFILSGFLVSESARRTATLSDFFRKRFLRIAPGFIVSTLLITYLLCPPFATNGAKAFVLDSSVLNLVVQIITFHNTSLHFANVAFYEAVAGSEWLPGFANGVLWTIRIEVIGYALIGLMGAASLFSPRMQPVLILIVIEMIVLALVLLGSTTTRWLADLWLILPSLGCGILMNWLVRHHQPKGWIAALCLAGLVPAVYFDVLPWAFCFCVAYPLVWLGSAPISLPRFYEGTDISYGVYLYGWPVTQLIRHFSGPDLTGYEMFVLALPPTMIVAWLSWVVVEKPALRLKARHVVPTQ